LAVLEFGFVLHKKRWIYRGLLTNVEGQVREAYSVSYSVQRTAYWLFIMKHLLQMMIFGVYLLIRKRAVLRVLAAAGGRHCPNPGCIIPDFAHFFNENPIK